MKHFLLTTNNYLLEHSFYSYALISCDDIETAHEILVPYQFDLGTDEVEEFHADGGKEWQTSEDEPLIELTSMKEITLDELTAYAKLDGVHLFRHGIDN